jgi:hypothetical protein
VAPSRSIRLRLTDKLPAHSPLLLYNTPWHTIYSASTRGSSEKNIPQSGDGYRFNLPLEGSNLPGCLHLTERGDGEVQWELDVNLRRGSEVSGVFEDIRSTHEIHFTPFDNGDDDTSKLAQGSSEKSTINGQGDVVEESIDNEAGMRLRVVTPRAYTRNDESLPVGIEISKLDPSSAATTKLKSLRRVKLEWWRRVTTPTAPATSASQEAGPSSRPVEEGQQEYLTILHRSGKSCRYSAEHPVRLLFELPPLTNITQLPGHDSCGEITQDTPYHNTSFFVKVIVGFVGQEENELVVIRNIDVRRALWREATANGVNGILDHNEEEETPIIVSSDLEDDDYPMTDAVRQQAYRLKGVDIVGECGTYRLSEAGDAGPSGSGGGTADPELPSFEAAARDERPPTFMQAISEEPGIARRGSSGGVPEEGELPSFNESQQYAAGVHPEDSGLGMNASCADGRRTPPPTQLTGELATWREFDGYETFSQPPPAAVESLGASGVMDMPRDLDTMDHAQLDPAALQDRMQLMERLGLGEGSRVIDTQEDMPPGFDEPSLPALPNAIMPHHARNRARRPSQRRLSMEVDTDSPPAFPMDTAVMGVESGAAETREPNAAARQHLHPPPSFAASEAAEAQGVNATGPLPILAPPVHAASSGQSPQPQPGHNGTLTPDLPPSYSNDATPRHEHVPPMDAPPSYT